MSEQKYLNNVILRTLLTAFSKLILAYSAEFHIIGEASIPRSGKVIIAPNHVSSFDGFLLQLAVSRHLYFMGKEEAFKNPFSAWLMKQLGVFPVNRGILDRNAIRNAFNVLDTGLALVVFPEGTRTYGTGLVPAKNGVSHIAKKTNSKIIPVTIIGAEKLFSHFFRKTKIELVIHNPIDPSSEPSPKSLTEKVMRSIASCYPSALRGIYG